MFLFRYLLLRFREDLTEEQFIVITQLKDEFEHKGVHLSDKDRDVLHEKFGKLQYVDRSATRRIFVNFVE